jgi:NAD(P)-dependent dehydrogenase (short-subunit alcohol dehydrogenase family)
MLTPLVEFQGGSRGLGLSTLIILLQSGINVVSLSRTRTSELDDLAIQYPEQLLVLQGDVAKDEENKVSSRASCEEMTTSGSSS